jgi:hypothetical protein
MLHVWNSFHGEIRAYYITTRQVSMKSESSHWLYSLCLFFDPEDGGNGFLRIVGELLPWKAALLMVAAVRS